MAGRPTKLTEEREADLVLLLAAGVPTGLAARSVGVSERFVERWLKDGLRERVAEARAIWTLPCSPSSGDRACVGGTKVVTAEHYLFALGDYAEVDYQAALARLAA